MTLRSNGSYIGPRPAGPSTSVASGIWDIASVARQRRAGEWPAGTDELFSSVSLLLHMDGSNGSTSIVDSSSAARTVTVNGSAAISTSQSKYGGASLSLPDTGSYLTVANGSHFSFDGNFTIESWIRPSQITGTHSIGGIYGLSPYPWILAVLSSGVVRFWWNDSSTITSAGSISSGQWSHIAVCRSSGTIRLFINGAEEASSSDSASISGSASDPLMIGRYSLGGTSSAFIGHIDEFRITKAARYVSNFTPPETPFPDA